MDDNICFGNFNERIFLHQYGYSFNMPFKYSFQLCISNIASSNKN